MSTEATPAAPSAPADTAPPAPPAAPTPAPVPTPSATPEDTADPAWLAGRLERERKAILRELGVSDVANAKAALAAYRDQQEAAKSEAQRQAERIAQLELQAKRTADLEAVLATKAEREFGGLTNAQRAAVEAIAGADPAARLRAIDALRPTWDAAPSARPLAAPASTSAAAPAPAPTAPAEQNVLATYEALASTNPAAAAAYRLANWPAYEKAIKARA